MKVLFRFVTTLGLVTFLSGCALTPDYERPDLASPQVWQEDASTEGSVANLPWWDLYQDPQDDQNLPIFQGGSFNREYDETFYKYGDDGTLSIEISVKK